MKFIVTVLVFHVICLNVFAQADNDYKTFQLGEFTLENGTVLPDTKLTYSTQGSLNSEGDNAILLPSFYAGNHHGYDFLIGKDKALDPEKHFIIATNMFANGLSSSPSNTPPPFNGPNFPAISTRDNVAAVYRLLTEELGVTQLKAIVGYSMGAQQAFQWAVSHPEIVKKVVGYCGTAKEYSHGKVRLESLKAVIKNDPVFDGGNYKENPISGLTAAGLWWAGWGTSPEWYRQKLYKTFGQETVEAHMEEFWGVAFLNRDAVDLLSQATTWQNNNLGETSGFDGDVEKALQSIKAPVLYLACETDFLFTVKDIEYESQFIPQVEQVVIPSIWGHLAGFGLNGVDNDFLNTTIKQFLE